MLSVHMRYAVTFAWHPRPGSADIAASTAPAPGHVHLHQRMHRVAGLDVDAAGVVREALADQDQVAGSARRPWPPCPRPSAGRRASPCAAAPTLPAFTPSRPPRPSFSMSFFSNTSTASPLRFATALGNVGQAFGGQVLGRRVREVAREQRGGGEHAAAFRAARRGRRVRGAASRASAASSAIPVPGSSAGRSDTARARCPRRPPAPPWRPPRRSRPASDVASRVALPAARAKAAAASRSEAASCAPASPTPTATTSVAVGLRQRECLAQPAVEAGDRQRGPVEPDATRNRARRCRPGCRWRPRPPVPPWRCRCAVSRIA